MCKAFLNAFVRIVCFWPHILWLWGRSYYPHMRSPQCSTVVILFQVLSSEGVEKIYCVDMMMYKLLFALSVSSY